MGTIEPKHLLGNYYLLEDLLVVKTESTDKGQYFRGAEIGEYKLLGVPVPATVEKNTKVN